MRRYPVLTMRTGTFRQDRKSPARSQKDLAGFNIWSIVPASRLTSKEAFLRHAGRRNIKIRSAVVGAQQRDNGLLFISLCALPQNAQNAAGICDNGARFPRLSDKARWCPTSRRIYHFRCAAGDECKWNICITKRPALQPIGRFSSFKNSSNIDSCAAGTPAFQQVKRITAQKDGRVIVGKRPCRTVVK